MSTFVGQPRCLQQLYLNNAFLRVWKDISDSDLFTFGAADCPRSRGTQDVDLDAVGRHVVHAALSQVDAAVVELVPDPVFMRLSLASL